MNVHAGPGQVAPDDEFKAGIHLQAHARVYLHVTMFRHIPFGKQVQLASQQGLVIGWQNARLGGELPGDQGVYSLQIHALTGAGVGRVNRAHHGSVAQVSQKHKAAADMPIQHLRYV